jgi:branched-chain amino acid aminotransferase
MTTPSVWVDGTLTPAGAPAVSAFDHGLLVGDGVFEALRVYGGRPFAWTRHIARLGFSAEHLGLTVPPTELLSGAARAVLDANAIIEGRLRITVTGGWAPLGSERGPGPPTVIVAASEMTPWPSSATVVHVPWSRNERGATAGLKTISYAENVRALAHAHALGASEAVFRNTRSELCEATGSNVFLVRDGIVRTPDAAAGCLLGVTRALVLELCTRLGIPATEAAVSGDALGQADEAFLTSTTRQVQAIEQVDGVPLPAAPGPVTTRLATAFADLVTTNPDP